MSVMLFQKEVWSCPSGHRGMPAWGTGVAQQQVVLDPRNDRTLKVPRAQLQCIASLWGQDNEPPDPRAGTEGHPGAGVALHSSSVAAVF